mgnify:CR=1 FL=1
MENYSNEHSPELRQIMSSPPRGLIISGLIWAFLCIIIIAGISFIKYPQPVTIPITYRGKQDLVEESLWHFKIEKNSIDLSKIELGKTIRIEINEFKPIDGILIDISTALDNKIMIIKLPENTTLDLAIGNKGTAKISISRKRLIEIINYKKTI